LFLAHNGASSYLIPIYQRRYDWPKENIERLYEDVIAGINSLNDDESVLTFLGTIILVKESEIQDDFTGQSLAVIDGQQRLTTLSLMIASLLHKIWGIKYDINKEPLSDNVKEWLSKEVNESIDGMFACLVGTFSSRSKTGNYNFYPRIIRARQDARGQNAREAVYKSHIASMLHNLSNDIDSDSKLEKLFFEYVSGTVEQDKKSFLGNVKNIEILTDSILDGSHKFLGMPKISDYSRKGFRSLFKHVSKDHDNFNTALSEIEKKGGSVSILALNVLVFTNFLLDRVALTRVEAKNERYAFDIFEALNTTGEPLSAIETFKPRVIQVEEFESSGYEGSESELAFKKIDDYFNDIEDVAGKQTVTREIVISFGLFKTGKKLPKQLSAQRHYLRRRYDECGDQIEDKRRFVQEIASVVDFYREFWSKEIDYGALNGISDAERQLALFCLSFIRDSKTSLAIPILARYRYEAIESSDAKVFVEAIKCLTAFIVLRRGATTGTAGIDTDLRKLMSDGHRLRSDTRPALCSGVGQGNSVPAIADFKDYLKSYLAAPKIEITDKDGWIELVAQQAAYKSSTALCRFMLLTASTSSVEDEQNPGMLKRIRDSALVDLMNLRVWDAAEFATVEHVAPDSKARDWDSAIHSDGFTRHSIGNLTLLPEKENQRVGNKAWLVKRNLYKAFSAQTKDGADEALKELKIKGWDVGPKTKSYIETQESSLSVLKALSKVETWDKEFIERRSKNLAGLVWENIARWLDL
jgi:uncharacterized protein with ParB-like and HNH nuclease domain